MALDDLLTYLRNMLPNETLLKQIIDPQNAGGYGEKSFSAAALMYYMLQRAGGELERIPVDKLYDLAQLDEIDGLEAMDDYWGYLYGAIKQHEILGALSDLRRYARSIFGLQNAPRDINRANISFYVNAFIQNYAKKGLQYLNQ